MLLAPYCAVTYKPIAVPRRLPSNRSAMSRRPACRGRPARSGDGSKEHCGHDSLRNEREEQVRPRGQDRGGYEDARGTDAVREGHYEQGGEHVAG